MKKMIMMAMATVMTIAGFAQGRNAEFGIKAGVNLADYNDAVSGASTRTGYHVGLLAHIHLSPNWALQPEVVYSTQGAEFGNAKEKVDYINIPVLAQYMFRGGFRLQTGPQIGILTSAKSTSGNTETSIRNGFNSTDFGWTFGIGYLSSSRLGFDARYNLGISDITKGGGDVNNRVLQLGLFYQFRH
jgi:hypothetical protein